MRKRTGRRISYLGVFQLLSQLDRLAVTTHRFPDMDALGSLVAFVGFLRKLGKKAEVLWEGEMPLGGRFLGAATLIEESISRGANGMAMPCEVLVALDCADTRRLMPSLARVEAFGTIINVDHHASNTMYGDYNLVRPDACATAEMVYHIFAKRVPLDAEVAESLYAGIVFDTGRFQYANTTATSFSIASKLLRLGVRPEVIFRNVFENIPFNLLKLYAFVYQDARFIADPGLIYAVVKRRVLHELSLTLSATEFIVDSLRAVEGVKLAAVFKEVDSGYRVSLRSTGEIDASKIAVRFGGGGHVMASGFETAFEPEKIVPLLVEMVRDPSCRPG